MTRRDRMQLALRRIKDQLQQLRHYAIPQQGARLRQVVQGYFAYHAVPTNARRLSAFRHHVIKSWLWSLRRRSQKELVFVLVGSHHPSQPKFGCRSPASFIRGRSGASPSITRGGSPVRESRTPGSVRGVFSNGHSYRDNRPTPAVYGCGEKISVRYYEGLFVFCPLELKREFDELDLTEGERNECVWNSPSRKAYGRSERAVHGV